MNLETKYYEFLSRTFRFDTKIKIYPVDFDRPWYWVFGNERIRLSLVLIFQIVNDIFDGLLPLLIGLAIESRSVRTFSYLILVYFVLETVHRFAIYHWHILLGNIQSSVLNAVQVFFLTTDPIHHSTKSSGKILSKINAGAGQGFLATLVSIFFDILPIVLTYFTVAITLLFYNFKIGIVAVVFFVIITLTSSFLKYFHSKSLKKPWIKVRDDYMSVQTENLHQNALIRASFATPEQLTEFKEKLNDVIAVRNIRSQGNSLNTYFMRTLYCISITVVGTLLFQSLNAGEISTILATTLLLTYYNGSRSILKIGDTISSITESIGDTTDLFEFIREFGRQSYPVVEENALMQKE
jgi:ABC-type multidrug transport system fused ATPase/permease subunit